MSMLIAAFFVFALLCVFNALDYRAEAKRGEAVEDSHVYIDSMYGHAKECLGWAVIWLVVAVIAWASL